MFNRTIKPKLVLFVVSLFLLSGITATLTASSVNPLAAAPITIASGGASSGGSGGGG
ncbi:MAG: hypothetical protein AB8G95_01145 [Anaerolineae bacterium]